MRYKKIIIIITLLETACGSEALGVRGQRPGALGVYEIVMLRMSISTQILSEIAANNQLLHINHFSRRYYYYYYLYSYYTTTT